MALRSGLALLLSFVLFACDGESEGEGDDGSSAMGGTSGSSSGGGASGGGATGGSATGGTGTGGSSRCDGGSGGFSPAAVEAADDYCTLRAAYITECGTPDDDPTCPEISCLERVYESDAFVAYAECQMQKACTAFLATDDDCFESAGGPITPEIEEFVSFCETRLDECAPSLSDDICSVVSPVIQRSIFCAVDACLHGACDATPDCLERASAAIPDCW